MSNCQQSKILNFEDWISAILFEPDLKYIDCFVMIGPDD